MRGAHSPQTGFTLIEVLAALVIVSLGMLAVIGAVGQTASTGAYLRDKTIAHWVAMNQLTKVRLQTGAPEIDKSSDEVEMAGRRWRWTMNVTQTPVESIRRIEVSVRPEDAPENSSLALVIGLHGTAVAPPGGVPIIWEGVDAPAGGQGGGGEEPPPEDDGGGPDDPPDSAPRDVDPSLVEGEG